MKQTILSKCLGKMKRVALTLFAALCVGSVWAEELIFPLYQEVNGKNVSVGYKVWGLGDNHDEVVVVFTNHTQTATWTVPRDLENVQFLVVGGGGGGGGDTKSNDGASGGAGGGGGGVVTGLVNFVEGSIVSVNVGNGGLGGKKGVSSPVHNLNAAYGAASSLAGDSSFYVDNDLYIKAYAGGADQGGAAQNDWQGNRSGSGGSSAGCRFITSDVGNALRGVRGENATYLEDVEFFGQQGAVNTNMVWAAGGGGGASRVGLEAPANTEGGAGGEGLLSYITGQGVVYGSGGGGGSATSNGRGGLGGTGAGNGHQAANGNGGDALPNQGGGGGGGGGKANGGNGGSGIVVFRYSKINAVANIGDKEYESLEKAIGDATENDVIQLVADIATDAAFEITKKVTINLNGKTIATTQADTEGNGVFWVQTGGELTLNGEGTINGVGGNAYNIAIWADGGKVIINGGTYTNVGAQDPGPDGAHFDLIYAKNGGSVEINGGTFICETPRWTLNSHNTEKGTFVVKGGTFKDFNPADVNTDDNVTTWCDEGYVATQGQDGYWTVAAIPVSNNVAKIGGTEYETLKLAFEAAATMTDPVTVTLLKDVEQVVTVPTGFNGTIDLGGKTVTGRIYIANANIAILNGSVTRKRIGEDSPSRAAIEINAGSLTLSELTVYTDNSHGVRLNGSSTGIINSGTYTLENHSTSGYHLLYVNGDAHLKVYGGNFNGELENSNEGTYVLNVISVDAKAEIFGGVFYKTKNGSGAPAANGDNIKDGLMFYVAWNKNTKIC